MVLYARYSELVGGDDALERQDEDGYEFAEGHGATIEKVYDRTHGIECPLYTAGGAVG
ncbi:hypothetical protein [Parafrankia soli]|uniref:hypothetical protein n=1 Tax=Parafrankia soli TaxID=2599596 RepID=UPI000A4BD058|nr:hypothetical protein [Parafrankia soli]